MFRQTWQSVHLCNIKLAQIHANMTRELIQVATNYFVTYTNAIVMASLLFKYSVLYLHYHFKRKLYYANNTVYVLIKFLCEHHLILWHKRVNCRWKSLQCVLLHSYTPKKWFYIKILIDGYWNIYFLYFIRCFQIRNLKCPNRIYNSYKLKRMLQVREAQCY